MIERSVDVGSARLYARLEGQEGLPCVVLSNSLATDHTLWDEQIAPLSERHRILRYDTRGHGRSEASPGPYSMDMLVNDVRELLQHFGITRAHLAGVSLGGLIALAAAQRKIPELASIAVCDARADFPPEFARGMDDRAALVREKGIEAIVAPMTERWLAKASLSERPDLVATIRRMILTTSVEGLIGCQNAIRQAGLIERMSAISIPSLFVVGDQDAALPVEMMRAMAAQVAGSEFAVIEGAGHLANLEQPGAFNRALLKFLDPLR